MIKNQDDYNDLPILIGPITRVDNGSAKLVYIDINFPASHTDQLEVLVFQNYYVYTISVSQTGTSGAVSILENKKLMDSPYYENGAQNWFTLYASEFNSSYKPGQPIRIQLIQPSGNWNRYEIRSIKGFSKSKLQTNNNQTKLASNSSETEKSFNIVDLLNSDYKKLVDAAKSQMHLQDLSTTSSSPTELKKNIKKKDKKHGRKTIAGTSATRSSETTTIDSAADK